MIFQNCSHGENNENNCSECARFRHVLERGAIATPTSKKKYKYEKCLRLKINLRRDLVSMPFLYKQTCSDEPARDVTTLDPGFSSDEGFTLVTSAALLRDENHSQPDRHGSALNT